MSVQKNTLGFIQAALILTAAGLMQAAAQPLYLSKMLDADLDQLLLSRRPAYFYQSTIADMAPEHRLQFTGSAAIIPTLDYENQDASMEAFAWENGAGMQYRILNGLVFLGGIQKEYQHSRAEWENANRTDFTYQRTVYPFGMLWESPLPLFENSVLLSWQLTASDFIDHFYTTALRFVIRRAGAIELSFETRSFDESLDVRLDTLGTYNPVAAACRNRQYAGRIYYRLSSGPHIFSAQFGQFLYQPERPSGVLYWLADSSNAYTLGLAYENTGRLFKGLEAFFKVHTSKGESQGFRLPAENSLIRFHYAGMETRQYDVQLQKKWPAPGSSLKHFLRAEIGYSNYNSGSSPLDNAERLKKSGFSYNRFNPEWFGILGISTTDFYELFSWDLTMHTSRVTPGYSFNTERFGLWADAAFTWGRYEADLKRKSVEDYLIGSDQIIREKYAAEGNAVMMTPRLAVLYLRNRFGLSCRGAYALPLYLGLETRSVTDGVPEKQKPADFRRGRFPILKNGMAVGAEVTFFL